MSDKRNKRNSFFFFLQVEVSDTLDMVELSELASAPAAANIFTVSDTTGLTSDLAGQLVSSLCRSISNLIYNFLIYLFMRNTKRKGRYSHHLILSAELIRL